MTLFEKNNIINFNRNGDGLLTTNVLPSCVAMIAPYNTFYKTISDDLIYSVVRLYHFWEI